MSLEWYQHLPEHIDPIVLSIGFFHLYWYSLFYMLSMGVSAWVVWRLVRGWLSFDQYVDLLFKSMAGVLVGSRLGYVLLYNFSFYAAHPLAVVWPFDIRTGAWIGIAGMSYYGGLVGVFVAVWLWVRGDMVAQSLRGNRSNPEIKDETVALPLPNRCANRCGRGSQRHLFFWRTADAIALAVSVGYVFGRIGNFLNGELYGRVTDRLWGMYFPRAPLGDVFVRHPSALYEAFFEGLITCCILILVWKRCRFYGAVASSYMVCYGFFRFWVEFFRETDPQSGFVFGWMTLGQIISVGVFCVGIGLFFWLRKQNYGTMHTG